MAFDGNITIGTTIDTFGMNNGLMKIQKSFKKLNKLAAIGLGIGAITKLGTAALEAASNLQEVQNIVDVSFGELSDKMERFSQIAIESYGMSEYAAKKTGSSFMAMGKSMGLSMEEASNMSVRLTALTGDMASFYNITQDYARIALSAVYTGETETLKRYGIILTEANLQQYALSKGIETSVKKMDARSKAILRYNYILQATKDMEGDFVRTQDTWANQVKVLQQRWQQFLIVLGNGLIKVLTPLIKALNMIVAELTRFAQIVGHILTQVFGIQWDTPEEKTKGMADNIGDAADAEDDLADAIDEANKKQKKQLQGYDELNNITTKKDTKDENEDLLNGLGVGGIDDLLGDLNKEPNNALPSWVQKVIDMLNLLKAKLKEIADFFNLGFLDAWNWLNVDAQIEDIKNKLSSIVSHIQDIINATKAHFDSFINTVAFAIGEVVASVTSIIASIIQMILGGIDQFLEENKQRIIEFINFALDTLSGMAVQLAMFIRTVAEIVEGIVEPMQNLIAQLLGTISTIFMGVTELLLKLARDIQILFTQPIIDNKDKIIEALSGLIDFVANIVETIKVFLQNFFDAFNNMYDAHIKPFFSSLTNGISNIVGVILDNWNEYVKPVLDNIAQKFRELVEQHLTPLMNTVISIIGKVFDVLKVLWETVIQPLVTWLINTLVPILMPIIQALFNTVATAIGNCIDFLHGLLKIIEGVIDFIVGVFTGDWDRAWKGVTEIFNGAVMQIKAIIEFWVDLFKGFLDVLKSIILGALDFIVAKIELIIETIENIFETALNFFIGFATDGVDSIIDVFNHLGDGIQSAMDWVVDTIQSAFDSIGYFIEDLSNGIIETFNNLKDAVLDAVDWILDKLDMLPDIDVGGTIKNIAGDFGIEIPHLAQGAVIPPNRQFMAVLGDQTSGTNVEAPLATIQEALYNALLQAGLTGGGSSNQDIVVQIDGREIARAVRREDNIFRKSTGTSMFAY